MFERHTNINVGYSENKKGMKYFCDSNIFGFISNYFWDLHYWTYCRMTSILEAIWEDGLKQTQFDHGNLIPLKYQQAEKLKSRKMKEGWMKNDEGWMKNDEGWKMNDEGWWFQTV